MKKENINLNILLNMIKTLSAIIFPLITYPYISRVLQPEYVGKINFSNSIVSYFMLIATLGITTYAVRECSIVREDKNKLSEIASQLFSINIITMIISYILLVVVMIAFPKLIDYRIIIAIQSINIFCNVIGTDWLNTAIGDFKFITLRTFIFQLLALVLMFVFVKKPTDYMKYVVITLIATGGANLANYVHCKRYCKLRFVNKLDWSQHLKPILLLFAMLIAQTILNSMDVTMLGFMKGDYSVGLYTTAVKLINVISQVVGSLFWVFIPQLTLAFSDNNYKTINLLLKKSSVLTSVLIFPIVAGVIVLSEEIIIIIGGKEYLPSSLCMCILCFSMLNNSIGNIVGNMILLSSKREKQFTIACVIGMLINLGLNLLLIPQYGIYGASIATVVSSLTIDSVAILRWDKKILVKPLVRTTFVPMLGSVVILIIGYALKQLLVDIISRTIITVVLCSAVYFIILVATKYEFASEIISKLRNKLK